MIMRTRQISSAMRARCSRWFAVALAAGLLLGAGCGDDEPQAVRPTRPAAQPNKAGNKGPAGKGAALPGYTKLEDILAPEEAKEIRHEFRSRDFEPDVSGNLNRDPFRSYVVSQPGIGKTGDDSLVQATEQCTKKQMVATNFSIRDLRLMGIVLRGSRTFALFGDSSGFGHIVKRNDCLGKEKARVSSIGSGFVTVEIVPEVGPNQVALPPQERSIQLYPEELALESAEEETPAPAEPPATPSPAEGN